MNKLDDVPKYVNEIALAYTAKTSEASSPADFLKEYVENLRQFQNMIAAKDWQNVLKMKWAPLGSTLTILLHETGLDNDPYISKQYDLPITDVSKEICDSNEELIEVLDHLSQGKEKNEFQFIKGLPSQKRFLLYIAIQATRMCYETDAVMLGGTTENVLKTSGELFGFIRHGYFWLKKHCIMEHRDIWNEITDWEIDHLE